MHPHPSYAMSPGLYAWDLYADGASPVSGARVLSCSDHMSPRAGFQSAAFYPGMEAYINLPAFEAFKASMVGHCSQYRSVPAAVLFTLFFSVAVLFALQESLPQISLSGVPLGAVVVVLAGGHVLSMKSRLNKSNERVDDRVRAELSRVNAGLEGRAHLTLHVANAGLCVARGRRLEREVRLARGAAPAATHVHVPWRSTATNDAHHAPHAPPRAPEPYYPPMMMAMPPQTAAPHTAEGENARNASAAEKAPYYAGDAENATKEIFVAAVPEGVVGGAEFVATSPSGRVVSVTAPLNARPGLEFQVHA